MQVVDDIFRIYLVSSIQANESRCTVVVCSTTVLVLLEDKDNYRGWFDYLNNRN